VQRTCLALASIFLSTGIAFADPTGEWMVEKGYAKVRIENCGNALWGAVSWEQKPGVDSKNPDPIKRTRPTLGMPVLLDMKPVESNKWVGQIYNSEDGQTYSSNISMGSSPDILLVRGCVLGFLCGAAGRRAGRFRRSLADRKRDACCACRFKSVAKRGGRACSPRRHRQRER
jgi:uncharacterized protein (DUF2147 family)